MQPKSMVRKSPSSTFLWEGTPWGMLLLTPLTTMGSKDMRSAPLQSIRYCRKAEISFSVRPGLMNSSTSWRAFSAMRWAAMRVLISSSSFTARRSVSSWVAGTSSLHLSFSFQVLYSPTVAYCSSKPRRWMLCFSRTSLARSTMDTSAEFWRMTAPVTALPAASM